MEIKKIETNLKRNLLLHSSIMKFSSNSKETENQVIRINPNFTFQKILGFGGALTESSCYILKTISKSLSDTILDEYFSETGLNYQFGRISIGSCDFSLKRYSYSYENDLSDFSIKQDLKYVVPIIKSIQKRNRAIQFIASPWSPPAFMKDNHRLSGRRKVIATI